MKFNKEELQALYDIKSLDEISAHLGVSKSTLHYHMNKLGIVRRNKSEAQRKHVELHGHQRSGTVNSDETKDKISGGMQQFWDSKRGQSQRESLRKLRLDEWESKTRQEQLQVINRLSEAPKPSPGELSSFGKKLYEFLSQHELVSTGIKITSDHFSDIILEEKKVVIELVFPLDIYGEEQKYKLEGRYNRLTQQINAAGYRVLIIEDKSNSVSLARCKRIYEVLCAFFNETSQVKRIVS